MMRKLFLFSIVSMLLLVVVLSGCGQFAGKAVETGTPTCTDSDGGSVYNVLGEVRTSSNQGGTDCCTNGDSVCTSTGSYVSEKFCNNVNNVSYEIYSCPSGCSAGACIVPGSIYATSTGNVAGYSASGASVYLDAETISKRVTPLTLNGVTPGVHTVIFKKTNYRTQSKTVTVVSGQTAAASVVLVGLGSIKVSSTPTGASVYVDDATGAFTYKGVTGATPVTISNVEAGTRKVKFTKTGYSDNISTVTVPISATPKNVIATLTKLTKI